MRDFDIKTRNRLQKTIDDFLEAHGAEFGSIIVMGSFPIEGGKTGAVSASRGDWYAQNGMMRHLIHKREHSARLEADEQYRENQ